MSEFTDKIRTIAAPRKTGQSERRDVVNEDNGKKAGYHVEHWDGRRDAVAQPDTVNMKIGVNDG